MKYTEEHKIHRGTQEYTEHFPCETLCPLWLPLFAEWEDARVSCPAGLLSAFPVLPMWKSGARAYQKIERALARSDSYREEASPAAEFEVPLEPEQSTKSRTSFLANAPKLWD